MQALFTCFRSKNLLLQPCGAAGKHYARSTWIRYLDSVSLNISTPKQLASLGPNGTIVLNPSKIPTSSLISGSCAPPGHLGNLALVFVLAHLAVMGFVAVFQKIK